MPYRTPLRLVRIGRARVLTRAGDHGPMAELNASRRWMM